MSAVPMSIQPLDRRGRGRSPEASRNADIAHRFDCGELQSDIAASLGISRQRVFQILARTGRTSKRPPRPPNVHRDEIIALRKSGLKPAAIARRMGLSRNAVIGVVYRAGLSTHTPIAAERPTALVDHILSVAACADGWESR